jgi:hypothetical protein
MKMENGTKIVWPNGWWILKRTVPLNGKKNKKWKWT